MTCRTVILDEAKREYRKIVDYLARVLCNNQAATGFVNEFSRQVDLIADNPNIHALSRLPELANRGYRACFIGNYVMLYKTVGKTLYIAHIFHQSQDYAKLV